jgi:hypothetical protein
VVRRLLRSSLKQNWQAAKLARGKTGVFGHGYWHVTLGDLEMAVLRPSLGCL